MTHKERTGQQQEKRSNSTVQPMSAQLQISGADVYKILHEAKYAHVYSSTAALRKVPLTRPKMN